MTEAFAGAGKLVHSGEFDGLDNESAKAKITAKDRRGDGELSPARLAPVAPALLGHADPDGQLPDARLPAGAGEPSCRCACPTT